jgi:hypothetical protein
MKKPTPTQQAAKPKALRKRRPWNMTSEQLIELATSKGFRSVVVEKGRGDEPAAAHPARVRKPPKPDDIPF